MNVLFLYECSVKKEDMAKNVKYITQKKPASCRFVIVYYVISSSIALMVSSIYTLTGAKNYHNGRVAIPAVMGGIHVPSER